MAGARMNTSITNTTSALALASAIAPADLER
jgi:hypothetical protein